MKRPRGAAALAKVWLTDFVNVSNLQVVSMANKRSAKQISFYIFQHTSIGCDVLKGSAGSLKLPVPVWEV